MPSLRLYARRMETCINSRPRHLRRLYRWCPSQLQRIYADMLHGVAQMLTLSAQK